MKLKTRKAVAKRVKITSKKKIKIRSGGQDHFNARESGKIKRNKRRDKNLSSSKHRQVKTAMPYS